MRSLLYTCSIVNMEIDNNSRIENSCSHYDYSNIELI